MLYSKNDKTPELETGSPLSDLITVGEDIPKYELPKEPMGGLLAYRALSDMLLDEGMARQNLATFCQTYMEPEAEKILSETLCKNAIDKSEYPRTAELENRCVNIISKLWNAPESLSYLGTSTVGSSEACMLGGMAMKFRWRKKAEAAGIDIREKSPNLVISSGYQVCWEKFCVYWDIEMRAVQMDAEDMSLNPKDVLSYVDDYTIGVVGILGITYTGRYDDIEGIDKILTAYNKSAKVPVPIHVDAASGGLYAPFIEPERVWDFRLENVVSINTSGHKYGLVYPGIGWVIWRDEEYLPKELIFNVSYLGGSMPTMAINFSHSASQIIGQYFNFLRLGFEGYKAVHERTRDIAEFLEKTVRQTGFFEILGDTKHLPVVCYRLTSDVKWTLYDLSDRLQMRGWQVPTYPLPKDLDDIIIHRYVCRADFSKSMASDFSEDFKASIQELENAVGITHSKEERGVRGFTH
ncbi:MAG: glutamate decarboxylase [Clostridiales Family XIII bacterium]|jgi:glutamate decarboxylase|nr:glutamate decarboxylase [Clostridiales Family XIII bacterium]